MTRKILIAAIIVCSVVLTVCIGCIFYLEQQSDQTLQTEPSGTVTSTEDTEDVTEEATQPPTDEATLPSEQRFVLTFAGDCTLGTMPSWSSLSYCFNNVIGDDYDLPFRNVRHLFENDECTFVNLEGVFAQDGTPEDKRFTFMGPPEYVNILTGSSVEAVSLANNHTYDFGEAGYESTKNILDEKGVEYCQKDQGTLFTTENGLCIGIYGTRGTLDEDALRSEIARMRDAGAQLIIAAAHWGKEGAYHPNDKQIHAAYTMIDAGVDIVWGHHPHVLQEIEVYNDGIIFYSLGNFSFGGNHNPRDKDTAVLQQEIIVAPDGTVSLGELTIIPCSVSSETDSNDFQPTPVEEGTEQYDRILSKLDGTFDGQDLVVNYGTGS